MNPVIRILCATLLGSLACSLDRTSSGDAPGGEAAPDTAAPDTPSPPAAAPPLSNPIDTPSPVAPPSPAAPPEPTPADDPDAGSEPTVPDPAAPGPCCSTHTGGSCVDETITACVCAADPRCCSDGWDEVCVTLVAGLGCGECKADCCTASNTGGCATSSVETCVCEKAPECCASAWDDFCVLLASNETASGACGQCPGAP